MSKLNFVVLYRYPRVSVLPGSFLRSRRHRYNLLYVRSIAATAVQKSARSSCDVTDKLIIAVTSTCHVSCAKAYQALCPRIFCRRAQGEVPGNEATHLTQLFNMKSNCFMLDVVHSAVAESFARNIRRQTSLMHIAQVGCAFLAPVNFTLLCTSFSAVISCTNVM